MKSVNILTKSNNGILIPVTKVTSFGKSQKKKIQNKTNDLLIFVSTYLCEEPLIHLATTLIFLLIIGKIVEKEQFELLKPSESQKNNWMTDICSSMPKEPNRESTFCCFFGLTRFERWWKVEHFELLKYSESPKISELWLFVLLWPRTIGTRFETFLGAMPQEHIENLHFETLTDNVCRE